MAEDPVTIFPFSASDELGAEDQPAIDVYKRYLRSAFENANIRNIFVTGDYGVGKSSIIRTFEKEYRGESPNRFLYISLGEYGEEIAPASDDRLPKEPETGGSPPPSGITASAPAGPSEAAAEGKKNRQSFLERRMLLQIYSCFQKKDLPDSSFRMIPEPDSHSVKIAMCLLVCCILMGFFLLYFDALAELLVLVFGSRLLTPRLMNFLHLCVYGLTIVSFVCFARYTVLNLISKLRMSAFTVKLDTIEASCEREACETYIDHYTTEIVYCLKKIADLINYTVVIEDLDRVDAKIFFDIFTRLREINYLVNNRLEREGAAERMRFVYVASDIMVGQLRHTKFADFVLPVFPRLNEATAENLLTSKLKGAHESLRTDLDDKWKCDESAFLAHDGIVSIISPYIIDFRLQNAILNEYSLLIRLYHAANPDETVDAVIAQSILAVVVYKNLLPVDYSRFFSGKSAVLPSFKKLPDDRMNALFDTLTKRGFLTIRCLYYAGFKRSDIVGMYQKHLKKDAEAVLKAQYQRRPGHLDEEFWDALREYCKEEFVYLVSEAEDKPASQAAAHILQFYVRLSQSCHRYQDEKELWKDLFSENTPAINAISVLAKLDRLPVDWCCRVDDSWNASGQSSIFERCKGKTESFVNTRDLSLKEYGILQDGMGAGYQITGFVRVRVDDKGKIETRPIKL